MLQWGRDHVIAESEGLFEILENGQVLQWGRDHVIAESAPFQLFNYQ